MERRGPIEFLRDIPLSIRVGLAWVKALDLASERRHGEALAVIESMPERVQKQLSWSILRLQQHRGLGNVIVAHEEARELIPRIQKNKKLSERLKNYLVAYTKWMGRRQEGEDAGQFGVDWERVSLDVPPYWKRRFPLRAHPLWFSEPTQRRKE